MIDDNILREIYGRKFDVETWMQLMLIATLSIKLICIIYLFIFLVNERQDPFGLEVEESPGINQWEGGML